MNPHFLYNILESVNWRAKAIGENKISAMMESLGILLRSTLSEHDENFTLKKEMELVECYLTIQKIRFDEQLECSLNIDEAYLDAKIPKLVLQPLVENAIHYGLEEITDVCLISIHSCVEDEKLILKVKNSGTQFEENLLIKLANKEITPHGMGIGLQNINDRLKITFGDEYGLVFCNEPNTAVVKMIIPYQPI
jgi:two-component system sensor histidine kinase YesM